MPSCSRLKQYHLTFLLLLRFKVKQLSEYSTSCNLRPLRPASFDRHLLSSSSMTARSSSSLPKKKPISIAPNTTLVLSPYSQPPDSSREISLSKATRNIWQEATTSMPITVAPLLEDKHSTISSSTRLPLVMHNANIQRRPLRSEAEKRPSGGGPSGP